MSLEAQARQAAQKYGIPPEIFFGLIRAESSWNPNAVSRVGALGLTQVMPRTAQGMGYDPAQLAKSPQMQLEAGARYLSQMHKQFGKWDLALAAYNAGPGNVQKYGGIPPFKETQNYVPKVLGYAKDRGYKIPNAAVKGGAGGAGAPGDMPEYEEPPRERRNWDLPPMLQALSQYSLTEDANRNMRSPLMSRMGERAPAEQRFPAGQQQPQMQQQRPELPPQLAPMLARATAEGQSNPVVQQIRQQAQQQQLPPQLLRFQQQQQQGKPGMSFWDTLKSLGR